MKGKAIGSGYDAITERWGKKKGLSNKGRNKEKKITI